MSTSRLPALAARAGDGLADRRAAAAVDGLLEGFRAAPLSEEELLRRAGQLERFLRLVPIEYGRGVSDGRVTKDFEIQEAITFRDGAQRPFATSSRCCSRRDAAGDAGARDGRSTQLGDALAGSEPTARAVAPTGDVEATTASALVLIGRALPERLEGRGQDGRLRRHLGDARPARGRGRGG